VGEAGPDDSGSDLGSYLGNRLRLELSFGLFLFLVRFALGGAIVFARETLVLVFFKIPFGSLGGSGSVASGGDGSAGVDNDSD